MNLASSYYHLNSSMCSERTQVSLVLIKYPTSYLNLTPVTRQYKASIYGAVTLVTVALRGIPTPLRCINKSLNAKQHLGGEETQLSLSV